MCVELTLRFLIEKFKFGLFYVTDRSVNVYNISVIKEKKIGQLAQVTSRPDLDSKYGWVEINCPSTKRPKTLAAKLLLIGGLCMFFL